MSKIESFPKVCPSCGGHNIIKRGVDHRKREIVRYSCKACGKKFQFKATEDASSSPESKRDTLTIMDLERKVQQVREENKGDKRKIILLNEQLQSANQTIEALSALSDHKFPRVPVKVKPSFKSKNEATAVICLSDLHLEENVDPLTVNGLNEYNPTIAERRFKKVIENGLKLTDIQSGAININTLVVWLGGDIISGYIHQELVEGNHMSPVEAILFADRLLTWGFDFILNNSNYNIIVPTSNGNHGRTTPKIHVSTYAKNSYEYLLYKNLEKRYAGEKRIKFQVSEGYHNYLDVYDMKVRFHHGDSVKYNGGAGGIYIPINKAIAAWDSSIQATIDVMGHFHQLTCDRKFVCNGSLVGYGPYSLSIKASPEPPQQAFFLLDKERNRRTVFAPIFVD